MREYRLKMKFQEMLDKQDRNSSSQILLLVTPPFQNEGKDRLGLSFDEVFDEHNCLPSRILLAFWRDFAWENLLGSFNRNVNILEHRRPRPKNLITSQNKKAGQLWPAFSDCLVAKPGRSVLRPYMAVCDA